VDVEESSAEMVEVVGRAVMVDVIVGSMGDLVDVGRGDKRVAIVDARRGGSYNS